MTNKIAIIIPTRGRPERVAKLLDNIEKTTTEPYAVYFGVDPDDIATKAACKALNANMVINATPSKYGPTINNCYHKTAEPFLMLAADDVEFTKGWDTDMLKVMENPKIGIVGHIDNWPISKTGKHGSHLLVRRSYIQTHSGVEDEPDVIYSSAYNHYNTDIETEQTAMKRGAFAMSDALIHHHHWCNGEAVKDETYTVAQRDNMRHDNDVYNQRRHRFEQWHLESLQQGKVVRVNQGKLSVVMPIYNCPKETLMTIESLYANTYHEVELILVDNGSTDPAIPQLMQEITHPNVKKFTLTPNRMCTYAWNFGVAHATGDYVAVINNDITFSKNWDVVLMNELDNPGVFIANPYQTDPGCSQPYGKAERAGNIDIRGTCYMMSRKAVAALFPIPRDLVMWFNDYWLTWKVEKLQKKSVFCPDASVFHLGSKSSQNFHNQYGTYWWINRGDAYAFELMTGISTKHWQEICAANLGIDKP